MAVSADSLRLAIVKEATPGTVPPTPSFMLMRTTGEGLTYELSTTLSEEMGGSSRGVKDSILTGGSVTGDIQFELSDHDAFEALAAAALGSDWGYDPLTKPIGADEVYDAAILTTFTIEKRFTIDATDPALYSYHLFTGCSADTMTLSITPNEPITGSFGFVGNEMTLPDDEQAGATYAAAGTNPVMTAPLVTGIELIDRATMQPVSWLNESCFTGLEINITNNMRALACIGELGTRENVLGRFEASITGSLYYAADEPIEGFIDQTEFAMQVTCTDSLGSTYKFYFDRVKFTDMTVVAGGTNTDVINEFSMQALEGSPLPFTLLIERASGESPITAGPATGTGTTVVNIPLGGGPVSDAAYTATPAITVTGEAIGTPNPVAIVQGDKLNPDVIDALVAEFNGLSANLTATAVGDTIQIIADGTTITSIDTASVTIA